MPMGIPVRVVDVLLQTENPIRPSLLVNGDTVSLPNCAELLEPSLDHDHAETTCQDDNPLDV